MRRLAAAAALLGLAAVRPLAAAPFAYHDYDDLVAELTALAAAHPGLAEHFTAQDAFGLPVVVDGARVLEHHVLRITNEALGLDKPEVLLVGAQHGDEVVGLEVCLETARLLLESYGSDPWLSGLVDRREIYLMPLANPHGFRHGVRASPGAEGSEDMNRDHVYDRCSGGPCADQVSLSTVGARAIHELARRHLFRVVLDLHAGSEAILHPWGSPVHGGNFESPDERAATLLGQRMRDFGGPYGGFYPVGTAGELSGPVHGPLDDTAYAAGWDVANADPAWPTDAWRAVAYTVEISIQKKPPAAALGGDAALLVPGGAEDGWVPKNVRGALAAIDAAEPWVVWTNRAEVPLTVAPGEPFAVEWQLRGCFEVDDTHVRSGSDPDPASVFSAQTAPQQQTAGDPCFGALTTFSAEVTFDAVGTHYLTPVARVDSSLLDQGSPDPAGLGPQTWLVRSRTEDGLLVTNAEDSMEVNTVLGRLYRGAEPLAVEVPAEVFADGFETGDTSVWSSAVP